MTDDQFDDLVRKLEEEVRRKPAAYRFKVSLIAMLGNAYLSAILLFFLALFVALVVSVKWLSWIVVQPIGLVWVFLCLVLRSSWVKIEPTTGVEIKTWQAPALFAIIGKLRSELGAPCFDHVLITDELNAEVFESPRLGIFGWYQSFLLIGLPLMKSLTCEQLEAVLAHEFGHHARRHGRVSHSIYRQRLRWSRLMTELETTESKGSFLFKPFLDWFVPYFGAFSFPLARANEYEADAISVRLTSSRATAEALTSIEVVGGYLSDFYWPVINAEFGEKPQPSREPYCEMSDAFATRLDKATGHIWLEPAMARHTTPEDTHPALRDRLAGIGEEPSFSPPEPGQAADGLLGLSLEVTTKALDRQWKESILCAWEERHKQIQEGRRRLKELNENHAIGVDLTFEERIERAELTESIAKNATGALDQWRALHETVPDDARVCFALGSRLLMRDDDTGCALVERALEFGEDNMLKGCELLRDYHLRRKREEESNSWNRRLLEQIDLQNAAHRERARVAPSDKFEPSGLPKEALAELRAQLRAVSGLRSAYFLKKKLVHSQDRPLYVLGYSVIGLFSFERNQLAAEVLKRIQKTVSLPGQTLFINLDVENSRFRRKFRRVRLAKVFVPSLATRILIAAPKKTLGVMALLIGILLFLIVLNDVFHFTWSIEPKNSSVGVTIARLLFCMIMIAVGIKWLIDPLD